MSDDDNVTICVFARAPVPGQCKTRLAVQVGFHQAARIQARLTQRAIATAVAAQAGKVVLWCAPDSRHPFFGRCRHEYGVGLRTQRGDDLGERMHHTLRSYRRCLIVGTDCPALSPQHIARAADALRSGARLLFLPAEDGGYVLVGAEGPDARLFRGIPWGSSQVMAKTRQRIARLGLSHLEGQTLWDVDHPGDLLRARREGIEI